ncbi:MAG: extracellular solute-binding protein [Lachnospiraceae bacterium]|nr:extracellular solute-binding protein [Lachnospiraceae bacterium]
MKKFLKVMAAVMLLPTVLLSVSGCGKTGKTDSGDDVNKGPEMIYVPTEREIVSDSSHYNSDFSIKDGRLYFIIEQVNMKTHEMESFYAHSENLDGSDPKDTKFDLELVPEEYPMNLFVTDNGYKLVLQKWQESGSEVKVVDFDKDGKMLSSFPLEKLPNTGEDNYISKVIPDNDGNYIVSAFSGIYLYDSEGKIQKQIKIEADSFYSNNLFFNSKNELMLVGWDQQSVGNVVKVANFDSGKLEDKWKNIPEDIENVYELGDDKYLIFGNDKLFMYSAQEDSYEQLVNFMDIDLVNVRPEVIWMNDDKTISFVTVDWTAQVPLTTLVTLKEELAVDQASKKTITFGVMYANEPLKRAIAKYNRSNGEYRVELKEYENDARTSEDYQKMIDQYKEDVLAGNLDIVNTSDIGDISYDNLTDLYPYLEKENFDMSLYYEEVFKACENKGKLISLPTCFYIRGYMGNSDYVGKKDSWTFKEFVEFVKKTPDKKIFSYCTATGFLYKCANEMGSGLIDYENGTCNFDSPEFKELMEIAKRYPESFKEGDYSYSEYSDLQKGDLVLTELWLTDTMNLQAYVKILGDKFNPIGIPGKDGSSFTFMPQDTFGIVANCKEKDGAWEFLKTFLDDSYQDSSNLWNGYPIKKEFFEKKMDASELSTFGGGTIMADDMTIEIGPPTQEEFDIIKGIVNKASGGHVDDYNIQQIIEEEYSPYYNGKKSADEVAEVIQSRVSIYLAEKYH